MMWIKCNDRNKRERQVSSFIKKFEFPKEVKKAELKISTLGIFRVKINGHEMDDYFMPGYTNYNKFVYLCSYDVTEYVERNTSIIVAVADGWFAGRLGYTAKRGAFGSETKLYVELHIEYDDGERVLLQTDDSWKAYGSEILYADFFNGETVDERQKIDPLFSYDHLPFASVVEENRTFRPYMMQSVGCVKKLQPEIIKKEKSLLLDFKQNFAGVIAFKAKGKSGQKLIIRYSEMLSDNGELYVENLRSARCVDMLILADQESEFSPKFTYHGFRYAEIMVDNDDFENVEIKDIEGLVISQRLERTGTFCCSDDIVNKIYQNTYWGQLGNFISVPTDCPQRDERLGWTGDAQIFCDTAMYNADCNLFYRNYLQILRSDCLKNGSVPSFTPFFCDVDKETHGCPCWGDAIAVIPYMHYLAYGDKTIIEENLSAAKRWVDFYCAHLEDKVVTGLFSFGDWLSVEETTDKGVLMQCYFGYTLSLVGKMCKILGQNAGAYEELYIKAKEAFRKKYIFPDGKIKSDTQTAYLIAYSVGFMDAGEIKEHLLETIHRRGDTLTTGFVGVKFLLPVLCEIAEEKLAYEMIKSTRYPSWGYSVVNGATTIWERWNGYTEKEGFFDPSMNSFNHYSLGSCVYWLYAYVLGIRLSEGDAARGEVLVKPIFNKELSWVKGSYKMPKGKISVSWKYEKNNIFVKVETEGKICPRFNFADRKVVSKEETKGVFYFVLEEEKEVV